MTVGKLDFQPVEEHFDLVGEPVGDFIQVSNLVGILVSEIDPDLSDTKAFCEKYDIGQESAVNCVIVEARRADRTWYAACMIPATERIDVNGTVRKELDARKISFAPMDTAISLTSMEYGAITPIGLPEDWTILVDENAAQLEYAVIGSGIRKSKLLIPGSLFSSLPNAKIMSLTKASASEKSSA